MSAFLYTWNPKSWDWGDDLAKAINELNNDLPPYSMSWSCGNTRRIKADDTFFLMRLGVEPKGIIGWGEIASEPYPEKHWDEEKAEQGQQSWYTDLDFFFLSEKPFISLAELQTNFPELPKNWWTPQCSAKPIPEKIDIQLEPLLVRKWESTLNEVQLEHLKVVEAQETRLERLKKVNPVPTTSIVEVTVFNRNPDVVAETLYRARGICEDCKQLAPFLRATDGTPYLEVHHIIRLADGGEDTVENALALCPNCHRKRHYG